LDGQTHLKPYAGCNAFSRGKVRLTRGISRRCYDRPGDREESRGGFVMRAACALGFVRRGVRKTELGCRSGRRSRRGASEHGANDAELRSVSGDERGTASGFDSRARVRTSTFERTLRNACHRAGTAARRRNGDPCAARPRATQSRARSNRTRVQSVQRRLGRPRSLAETGVQLPHVRRRQTLPRRRRVRRRLHRRRNPRARNHRPRPPSARLLRRPLLRVRHRFRLLSSHRQRSRSETGGSQRSTADDLRGLATSGSDSLTPSRLPEKVHATRTR
jgi:hypothetical protein